MYHQRNETLKWVGLVLLVLCIGGMVWYSRSRNEQTGWVQLQDASALQQTRQESAQPAARALSTESSEPQAGTLSSGQAAKTPAQIVVHASGAVAKPGVYFLPAEARVVDVLQAAGGVTGSADLNQINLAELLADGVKVYIPYRGTTDNLAGSAIVARGTGSLQTGSASGVGSNSARAGKVNLNTATPEELETLPGIGPSKAAAILRYRAEKGRFKQAEDLLKISGIGEKTFAKLKDLISI